MREAVRSHPVFNGTGPDGGTMVVESCDQLPLRNLLHPLLHSPESDHLLLLLIP